MNKNAKDKLLVICGPTATGKTSLGIRLAKKFSGEIVSADSRQVYRYMDIGTGKDIPQSSKLKAQNSKLQLKTKNYKIRYHLVDGVPIWLLDVVLPDYQFSVADYVKCANLVIEDIWKRKKSRPEVEDPRRKASGLPILVGGTGFYIKAVVDGIKTIGVEPDLRLREKLRNYEITKLRQILKETCPERLQRMNQSDRSNPRRLIRAIEIALKLKTQNAKRKATTQISKLSDILMIGLTAPYKILYQRIDKRVEERVRQGAIEEIKRLLKQGYSWENSVLGETIGYKEWRKYFTTDYKLRTKKLLDEVIQRWKYDEHGLARRQTTWFKKDKRIFWFDISKKGWENKIEKLVKGWLNKYHADKD